MRAHHGVSIAAVSRRQLRPKLMRIRPRRSRDRGWGRVAGGWQATDVPGRPPTAVASAGAPLCGRARGGDARRRGRGDAHGGCTERCGQPRKLDPLPQPPSPPPPLCRPRSPGADDLCTAHSHRCTVAVPTGDTVQVRWSGITDPEADDWVGVYQSANASHTDYLDYIYVEEVGASLPRAPIVRVLALTRPPRVMARGTGFVCARRSARRMPRATARHRSSCGTCARSKSSATSSTRSAAHPAPRWPAPRARLTACDGGREARPSTRSGKRCLRLCGAQQPCPLCGRRSRADAGARDAHGQPN